MNEGVWPVAVKIVPISELRQKLKDILEGLERTGEPYFITQYSRPKAVLVRFEDYNSLVDRAAEGHLHIVRRPAISEGDPLIRGTRITVRHIVERVQAGQSLEDILAALPHLNAAQIYDALSYYHDHQAEMDRLMEEAQPEQVAAKHGLRIEKLADGIAIVRDEAK